MKKLLITVNGKRYEVDVEIIQDDDDLTPVSKPVSRTMDNYVSPITTPIPGKKKVTIGDSKTLTAPINGVIIEIPVTVGQKVKENDILFVLEAMKMKTNIASPREGIVKTIHVKVGDTIEAGQMMLTYE